MPGVVEELAVIMAHEIHPVSIRSNEGTVHLVWLQLDGWNRLGQSRACSGMHREIADRRRIAIEGGTYFKFCAFAGQPNAWVFPNPAFLIPAGWPAHARYVGRPLHH